MVLSNSFRKSRPKTDCIKRSKIKLSPHQLDTAKAFANTDSLLVVHEPGMGKTLTAISVAECYLDKNPDSHVVVITMVSLLENFTKEFKKYGGVDEGRYIFISYETFLSEYKKLKEKACNMFKNALVIIDEVHELRSFESNTFQSVMECIQFARKVLLLTATPYVNSVCDFISIINLLNKDYVIGPRKKASTSSDLKIMKAPTKIKGCLSKKEWWSDEKGNPEELIRQIVPFLEGKVSFATKGINPAYPREDIHTILIPMSERYQSDFKKSLKMSENYFYSSSRAFVNSLDAQYYSDKINFPLVLKMVSDPKNRNVIFTNWIEHGTKIVENVLTKRNLDYRTISGDVDASTRAQIVQDFNDGIVKNLLITTAGMAGIDLKGVTNIIVIDPVWNDANLRQIIGRGVRFNSHSHLPEDQRVVHVYLLQLVEREIVDKTMDIQKSKSGDKRQENELVLQMLHEISVIKTGKMRPASPVFPPEAFGPSMSSTRSSISESQSSSRSILDYPIPRNRRILS
jgi:superfamily II DNA or RNA helicase